jgi:hypothetical protein
MGWADLVAGTRRAANQLLGGVPVTAGALSGMGILDMKSELTLEDSVISIEYSLTVDTATFGGLQYGDNVYIDSGWYRVRQEPIRIGDGSDCIVMLELLADADVVLVGSSSAIFSLAAIAAGSVYVVGESTYALVITGSATGGEIPPALGASSAVLAISGTASGSVLAIGLSSISTQITGAAAGSVPVVGSSSISLGIIGSAAGAIGSVAIGSSSATLTIAGTASGAVRVTGTSAQALALTGSATAAVRVNGSSSQSMAISGASTGTVAITGISSRALAITGSAAGVIGAVVIGASTATLAITGSATGSVRVSGATTRALAISGAAAGAVAIAGASSQALAITGSAAGTAQDVGTGDYITTLSGDRLVTLSGDRLIILPVSGSIAGASTQTLTLAGSATATVRVAGSSSQVMALIGTSAGAVGASGASSRVLAITGAIAGTVRVSGASAQTLAITGSAAGTAGGSGFPSPTMYLPLTDDLLDDSTNGFTYTGTPTPVRLTSTPPPIASSYYAFDWDGGDALIYPNTPLLNPGTGDFSVSAFLRATSLAGMADYPAWWSKGAYQSSSGTLAAFRDRVTPRWGFGITNPWRETATGGTTGPGETWVRITIVRSGNTITMYQGTSVRGTIDATGIDLTSTFDFKVGGSLSDGNDNWQGGICDFVYIRGTALTAGQISSLQTSTYGALL